MISGETMQCCKVRHILQYHMPNKLSSPEKFIYFILLLFHLFRDGKELPSGHKVKIKQANLGREVVDG